MSTKCSVAYGEKYHFYEECWDTENIYIELTNPPDSWSAQHGEITIAIPNDIMDEIAEAWIAKRKQDKEATNENFN